MAKYPHKLWLLFSNPNKFFKSVEKEKTIKEILIPYALIYFIVAILSLVFSLPTMLGDPTLTGFQIVFALLFTVMIYGGFAFGFPFVVSGIVHIGALIFGARQSFFNTFKPITYGGMIILMYGFANLIVTGILLPFTKVNPYAVDPFRAIFSTSFSIALAINVAIATVGLMHALVVQVKGISKFQKVSNFKAFGAVFLFPLGVSIILLILVAIIVALFIVPFIPTV